MNAFLARLLPCLLAAIVLLGSAGSGHAAPKCPDIAADVRKAVAADPSKTLMIVEDALVISEACACEIVVAAIEASKADTALRDQIIQTAFAVAPKMAPALTACLGLEQGAVPAAAQTAATDPTASGKDAKSVLPVPPAPVEDVQDFAYIPRDVRGIYLIAPGGVGIVEERTVEEVCKPGDKETPRRRVISPISRSVATN